MSPRATMLLMPPLKLLNFTTENESACWLRKCILGNLPATERSGVPGGLMSVLCSVGSFLDKRPFPKVDSKLSQPEFSASEAWGCCRGAQSLLMHTLRLR